MNLFGGINRHDCGYDYIVLNISSPAERIENTRRLNRINRTLRPPSDSHGTDYNARVWISKCHLCSSNPHSKTVLDAWMDMSLTVRMDALADSAGQKWSERWDWTREDHIIAFHWYKKIEFGKIHMGNVEVVELANVPGHKSLDQPRLN